MAGYVDRFRCDYCGNLAPLSEAVIFFERSDEIEDGAVVLWTPAVYCSGYCGRTATSRVGAGRG